MSFKSTLIPFYHSFRLSLKYPFANRVKVMRDYLSLYRTKGLTTDEYRDFEFENHDASFREAFLGLNEQRFYLDFLNPIKYYSIARNKYLSHKVLENTGVRKTELFCYYQPEARYVSDVEYASNLQSVLHILTSKNVDSCVVKTAESSHGDSVWVIKRIEYRDDDAVLTRFDGQTIMLSSILGQDAILFESVVHQTKQFSDFNESSVNTVRFMTTLWPDGSARIIAAFIKIGRKGKCVDNAGKGGNVDVCVDVETGRTQYAIQYDGWRNVKEIDFHPDNGCKLNNVVIENWSEIKKEVERFQQAFPFCKAAGWDVAITDEGAVIIEVNDFWDRTGQYFIRRGWRKEIRDCYFAWKEIGKEYKMYRQPNALSLKNLNRIISNE